MHRIISGYTTCFLFLVFAVTINFKVSQCYNYRREASSVQTIEVFAIVDRTLAEILGSDKAINDYVSSNFNAANRYFRQFKDPELHLKLVALKILRSEAEEDFLIYERDSDGSSILHYTTLNAMARWLTKNKDTLPKNDLAYLLHGYRNRAGYAYKRGKDYCGASAYDKPVAMADTWGETGSAPRVTAHEIGHTLGCDHCESSGYVMCSGEKVAGFHESSEKVIYETLKSISGKCLSTLEATDEQVNQYNFNSTIMPGDVVTLDLQCERYFEKGAKAIIAESNCDKLFCLMPSGTKKETSNPAVGTTELCPKGQRCFEGICKAE